jgi:peptidoglycan lytic transglycosylase
MSCGKRRWALLISFVAGCATTATAPPRSQISEVQRRPGFEGKASWYGKEQHGGPTASGERYNMYALTAAHRTLPMNAHVRCTNLRNGKSVTVRINDRGPYGRGRVIDLSFAAAKQLDMLDAGVVPIHCEVLP